jgi:hypothetical protein
MGPLLEHRISKFKIKVAFTPSEQTPQQSAVIEWQCGPRRGTVRAERKDACTLAVIGEIEHEPLLFDGPDFTLDELHRAIETAVTYPALQYLAIEFGK